MMRDASWQEEKQTRLKVQAFGSIDLLTKGKASLKFENVEAQPCVTAAATEPPP